MSAPLVLGVLAGAILSGTSLLYATLGETIVERAGIVNLGLEGILRHCVHVSLLRLVSAPAPARRAAKSSASR